MKLLSKYLPFLLICFIGFIIYSNIFHSPFVFDDLEYIVNNFKIRNIGDLNAVWTAGNVPSRFVGLFSFALNYHFHQLDVFGYHLVNVIIHITTALCLWWFVCLITRKESQTALFTALLFLAHPLQTQAVTYISQRLASLATLFYLLTLCLYLKGRVSNKKRVLFWSAAFLTGLLGMFTKEICFTLPFAVLLIEFVFYRKERIINGRQVILILSSCLIVPAFFSFNLSKTLTLTYPSLSHAGDMITSPVYLLTQFRVILIYLKLFFFPVGQNLDYDFAVSRSFFEPTVIAGFVVLVGMFLLAWKLRSRNALIAFGLFWFLLTLSVESSVIPIRHVIFEHRMYLPSIGLCIGLCAGLFVIIKDERKFKMIMSVMVALLCLLTFNRNQVWTNGITLWQDVVKKSPNKSRGYNNLGAAYIEGGQYDLAITSFNQALAMDRDYFHAYNNRGSAYMHKGEYESAVVDFTKAIELKPYSERAFNNRANAYKALEQYALALEDVNKAIEEYPYFAQALYTRALIHKAEGRMEDAIVDFNESLRVDPRQPRAYYYRGEIYLLNNDQKNAFNDFSRAIALNVDNIQAYNNRSIIYSLRGRPDLALQDLNVAIQRWPHVAQTYANRGVNYKKLGKWREAILDYSKAIKLKPDYAQAYYNRGGLYKLKGYLEEALNDFNQAIMIDPENINVYFERANVYLQKEQVDQAQGDYEQILLLESGNAQAIHSMGKIAFVKKDYARAVAYFDQAIAINPEYAQAYYFRSYAHQVLGRNDQALFDILKAQSLGQGVDLKYVAQLRQNVK